MAQRLTGRFEAKHMVSINMTPMVPVLLAVFAVVLIAGGAPTKALFMDMPGCSLGLDDRGPGNAWVSVDGGGRYRFNDEQVSASHLSEHLRALGRKPGARLLVRGEADVPYGEVAKVVKAAKSEGLAISFIPEELS